MHLLKIAIVRVAHISNFFKLDPLITTDTEERMILNNNFILPLVSENLSLFTAFGATLPAITSVKCKINDLHFSMANAKLVAVTFEKCKIINNYRWQVQSYLQLPLKSAKLLTITVGKCKAIYSYL